VMMMIFRPEGMFPARQQLLAYGKAARDMLRRAPDETKASA
jgi:branched-chain amino acid transport system permease protein